MQLYLVMLAKRLRKGTWSEGERERKTHTQRKSTCVGDRQTEIEGCRERREKNRKRKQKGEKEQKQKEKEEGELEKERKGS